MNNSLSDILTTIIGTARHQYRSEAFGLILNLIADLGYLDGLEKYYNYSEHDIIINIDSVESDVVNAFSKLCDKIGITVNKRGVYEDPRSAAILIDSILNKFDNYEDYESLLNIFHATDSYCVRFQDMCNLMVNPPIDLTDIIVSVNPTLDRIIDGVFNNKILAAAKYTKEYDHKFLKYAEIYPNNPSIWTFMSAGPETDVNSIINSLQYPDDLNQSYVLEMYIVGLSIFNVNDFDLSYANLEVFLNQINADELPKDDILLKAYNSLLTIYNGDSR